MGCPKRKGQTWQLDRGNGAGTRQDPQTRPDPQGLYVPAILVTETEAKQIKGLTQEECELLARLASEPRILQVLPSLSLDFAVLT